MQVPNEIITGMAFLTALGGLWWRLEQIKKNATDVAAWRQAVDSRISSVEKELARGEKKFTDHARADGEILSVMQDIKVRLARIETTLEIKIGGE